MDFKKYKDSWDAGFRAGFYNELPGFAHGFDQACFNEGFIEGKEKREGKASPFYIDALGQVQVTYKVRVGQVPTRFFQEIIL